MNHPPSDKKQLAYVGAATLLKRARHEKRTGLYRSACPKYEAALQMLEYVFASEDNVLLAQVHLELGLVQDRLEKPRSACVNLEAALAMKRRLYNDNEEDAVKMAVDMTSLLDTLGNVYRKLEKYEKACDAFQESLQIQRSTIYGKDAKNIRLARTLHNLGLSYQLNDKHVAARVTYEEAIDMFRHLDESSDISKDDNMEMASTIRNLSILYQV